MKGSKSFEEAMIDLMIVADEAGCTDRDFERIVDAVLRMFSQRYDEIRYTCVSGKKIIVKRKNNLFEVEVR